MTKIPWLQKIVVLTLEGRSFDQVLGSWPHVDGIESARSVPTRDGRHVAPFPIHWYSPARWAVPSNSFDSMHRAWNAGAMNGFLEVSDLDVMGYYRTDTWTEFLPMLSRGRILDHYFSSVMGPGFPNRLYLMCGDGLYQTDNPPVFSQMALHAETLFDQLSSRAIDWRYYAGPKTALPLYPLLMRERLSCPLWWFPRYGTQPLNQHIRPFQEFFRDVRDHILPPVSFLSAPLGQSAHPPLSLYRALSLTQRVLKALEKSSSWDNTLYICQFDSNGGFYDHVSPLPVDGHGPGFRVPAILWSGQLTPQIIHHRYDHTSLLRLIEEQFALPLLGSRTHQMASLASAVSDYLI